MIEVPPVFCAPSGRKYHRPDIELFRDFFKLGTVGYSENPISLNAGGITHVYVKAREELTQNVCVLRRASSSILRTAEEMMSSVHDTRQICFIGVPTAGNTLAEAAALESSLRDSIIARRGSVAFQIMRSLRKKHGLHRTWVDGIPDPSRQRYFVVDNVATSSKAMSQAIRRLCADGYPVKSMDYILLVDRQQGAVENLTQQGYRVRVVYPILDILAWFVRDGLWTQAQFHLIEDELRANQYTRIRRAA